MGTDLALSVIIAVLIDLLIASICPRFICFVARCGDPAFRICAIAQEPRKK